MTPSEQYAQLYALLKSLREESAEERKALQAAFEQACAANFKKAYPRRKFSMSKSETINQPAHGEIFKRFSEIADWQYRSERAEDVRINWLLDSLAVAADLPKTEEETAVRIIDESAYRSQGWGAAKYARNAARDDADAANFHGVEARVLESVRDYGDGLKVQEFRVMAKTTAMGWDIIRRRPGMTILQWAVNCWRRGSNPKVYNPFIPQSIYDKSLAVFSGKEKEEAA
jgi:hypothetical protein